MILVFIAVIYTPHSTIQVLSSLDLITITVTHLPQKILFDVIVLVEQHTLEKLFISN